jgi:hypothetical protein
MTCERMGLHLARGMTGLEVDIGTSHAMQSHRAQIAFLQHAKLTPELAKRISQDLHNVPVPDGSISVSGVDRCMVLDMIDRLQRGEIVGNWPDLEKDVLDQVAALSSAKDVDWHKLRVETRDRFDQLVRAMQQPTFRAQQEAIKPHLSAEKEAAGLTDFFGKDALEKEIRSAASNQEKARLMRDWIADKLADTTTHFVTLRVVSLNAQRQVQLVFALARCLQAKGSYPDRLEALTPDFLPAIPLDPFVEKPFGYARTDEGYLLWSVGPNGRQDVNVKTFLEPLDTSRKDDRVIRGKLVVE